MLVKRKVLPCFHSSFFPMNHYKTLKFYINYDEYFCVFFFFILVQFFSCFLIVFCLVYVIYCNVFNLFVHSLNNLF